jgi:hypothetical protein
MSDTRITDSKPGDLEEFVLGRAAFERISAVEGIEPSVASRDRSRDFDEQGLAHDARRRAIIEAHRPRRD